MIPARSAGYRLRSVLAAVCLVWAGCGSIGEPLPPLLHIPGRVVDFAVRQEAAELVAQFTWPTLGTEGQVFREMERFEIYAVQTPLGGAPPSVDALNQFGELAQTIPAKETESAGPGILLTVRGPLDARFGMRVGFAIRGVSSRGKVSPWSELKILDVVQPPGTPSDLEATTVEQGIHLRWRVVADAVDYQLERQVGTGEFAVVSLPATNEYLDAAPEWGTSHVYRVRARKTAGQSPEVSGLASAPAAITPMDVFPPAVPADLRVLATEGGVELSWSTSSEPDLAGYRVFRDGVQVHESLIESANYSDLAIPAGQSVRFQVTAVDRSGNSSSPAEASVTAPQ